LRARSAGKTPELPARPAPFCHRSSDGLRAAAQLARADARVRRPLRPRRQRSEKRRTKSPAFFFNILNGRLSTRLPSFLMRRMRSAKRFAICWFALPLVRLCFHPSWRVNWPSLPGFHVLRIRVATIVPFQKTTPHHLDKRPLGGVLSDFTGALIGHMGNFGPNQGHCKCQSSNASAKIEATCDSKSQVAFSGGGGNRTRVPRHFRASFYVRSRIT
jgi:hypothetical protein